MDGRKPLHVTLRLVRGLPSLRAKKAFRVVRGALAQGAARFGFRLVHYSVQKNHLHLIVEAEDKRALSRGMQGLQIRLARGLNKLFGRRGRVFGDRYHAHVLRGPREARNAIAYCINNARKHAAQIGRRLPRGWLDPFSTAAWFFGRPPCGESPPAAEPKTWLLKVGWRRGGRDITPNLVPASI